MTTGGYMTASRLLMLTFIMSVGTGLAGKDFT